MIQSFGPIAFGLISILILWARIVGPELAKARVSNESISAATSDAREAASSARDAARASEQTAAMLMQFQKGQKS